jgi:hypothetical protein
MIIDYVDGVTLSSLGLSSLNEIQRIHLYNQLADVFIQLRLHEFSKIGSLSLSSDGLGWTLDSYKRPLSIDLIEQEIEGLQPGLIVKPDQAYTSTADYIDSLIRLALNQFERGRNSVYDECDAEIALYNLHQFRTIALEWVNRTYDDGPFVLIHGDLRLSNIIVREREDPTIMAIIDWEWSRIVPAQLLVPPTWLTGHELDGICQYFQRQKYIHELIKLREVVKLREGNSSASKDPSLSKLWSGIEDHGSFLIAGSLLCSTYIDVVYTEYLDHKHQDNADLPGRAKKFISAKKGYKDLVDKKVADRIRYLEELKSHGIIEKTEDLPVYTFHPLIQERLIAEHRRIFAEDDQLCAHKAITAR